MNDPIVVLLGSERTEHLRIEVVRRLHAERTDYWDGNWIEARIVLRAGGFRATVAASLRTTDFTDFRGRLESLHRTLRGDAEFATLEQWVALRLSGDGFGHFTIHGELRDQPGSGNVLAFELPGLDQTDLQPLLDSLLRIEAAFPTLGGIHE
jgi:hypothetical protein